MNGNRITFADLSTYTPKLSKKFYTNVFGWRYHEESNYHWAHLGKDKIVSGLYEMPEKFKQLLMPNFWMTYIQVEILEETVQWAKELGGIVEIVNKSDFGNIALIRDPLGAGFTVYEGDIEDCRTNNKANRLIWNELHLSDVNAVIPFYQNLFNWSFGNSENGHYSIIHADGTHIADALEIPNELKGKYEYWTCVFSVEDLKESANRIQNNGGALILDEGSRMLFHDHSGSAFFYIQKKTT